MLEHAHGMFDYAHDTVEHAHDVFEHAHEHTLALAYAGFSYRGCIYSKGRPLPHSYPA